VLVQNRGHLIGYGMSNDESFLFVTIKGYIIRFCMLHMYFFFSR
jgi:hypothetical protein